MTLVIPTPLRSYTGRRLVEAEGADLAALLADLDHRFPGIRFRVIDEQERIRPHIRIFVDGEQVSDLTATLNPSAEVVIVPALSGG